MDPMASYMLRSTLPLSCSENCDALNVPSFTGYAWILGLAGTCKQC